MNNEDSYAAPGLDQVPTNARAGFKVVIVGSGMSGLLAGIRLKEAGIPFVIFERHANVGGTWYQNTYPGCRVDSPNHTYSYTSAERCRSTTLSRGAAEVLRHVATGYGFASTPLQTPLMRALQRRARDLAGRGGRSSAAELDARRTLINRGGSVNRPKWPEIPAAPASRASRPLHRGGAPPRLTAYDRRARGRERVPFRRDAKVASKGRSPAHRALDQPAPSSTRTFRRGTLAAEPVPFSRSGPASRCSGAGGGPSRRRREGPGWRTSASLSAIRTTSCAIAHRLVGG